jgi:hypothetical protein
VARSRAAGDKPPHSKEAGADRSRAVGEAHSRAAGVDSRAAGVARSKAAGDKLRHSNSQEAGVDRSRVGHKEEHPHLTSNKVDLLPKEPRPAHKVEPPTNNAVASVL